MAVWLYLFDRSYLGFIERYVGIDYRQEVLHCVQRGPLSITVAESGTLSSQQELKIKSQVDGRKTIYF